MGYFHLMITSAGNLATNGCLMAIPGSRYSKLTPLNKVYDCFCCWFRCCLTYQKPFSSVLELTSLQESFTVSLSSKSPLEKDQNALPVHVLPSPEYPALHAHAYDPTVLLHTALTPQLWALEEHSSISGKM